MVQLDLSENERQILAQALEIYVSNLAFEIGDTDNEGYRNLLKDREAVLRRVLGELRQREGQVASG